MNSYYEKVDDDDLACIDDEIPFELPGNWAWSRLGSLLAQLLSGSDLTKREYNSDGNGIPYMTGASNVLGTSLIINRWTETPKNISEKGDLLITCKGTVGLTAFNTIGDIHIARQFMALKSCEGEDDILLKYLMYYLTFRVKAVSENSTGLIPGIDRSTVLTILVPVPPNNEQLHIVNRLESIINQIAFY